MLSAVILAVILAASGQLLLQGIGLQGSWWLLTVLYVVVTLAAYVLGNMACGCRTKKGEDVLKDSSLWMKYIEYIIWYALWLFIGIVFRRTIKKGIFTITCFLTSALNDYYEIALHLPEGYQNDRCAACFLIWVMMALLVHILWGNYHKAKWYVVLEIPVVAMAVGLLVGQRPHVATLVVLVPALVIYRSLFLISASGQKPQQQRVSLKAAYNKRIEKEQCIVAVGIILLLFSICTLVSVSVSSSLKEFQWSMVRFQKTLESRLGNLSVPGFSDGRLSNKEPKKTHQTVMTLTYDEEIRGKVYLPGFIGESYDGNGWKPVNKSGFHRKNKPQLKSVSDKKVSRFLTSYSYNMADCMIGSGFCNGEITYSKVWDSYSYLPYYSRVDWDREGIRENGDGSLKRTSNKKICFETYDVAEVSSFFPEKNEVWQASIGNFSKSQFNQKELYEEYVKNTYLSVPEHLRGKLTTLMGSKKEKCESEAILTVRSALHKQAEYSTRLGKMKLGEDFVEHFLFQEKKGYCTHFATAGTLMFRSLGIPARYVSGYSIYPDEFKANEKGTYTAKIKDDAAHAWTEIYIEDFGWMPVEVTPGFEGPAETWNAMRSYDRMQRLENDYVKVEDEEMEDEEEEVTTRDKAQQTTTQQENAKNDQKSSANQNEKKTHMPKQVIHVVLVVIAIILAVALLMFLMWMAVRKAAYHLRHQADCDRAVTQIRKQLLIGLIIRGHRHKKGETGKQYLMRVCETMEHSDRLLLEQFWQVLEKQAYSCDALCREDVEVCNRFYERIMKKFSLL